MGTAFELPRGSQPPRALPRPLTWPCLPLSWRKLPSARCRSGTGGQSFCFMLLVAGKVASKANPRLGALIAPGRVPRPGAGPPTPAPGTALTCTGRGRCTAAPGALL